MTKLLIVDDEPLTVDMLETFLQINGYETIGAFNGEDGLVLVQAEEPEIIILDLMLPDIEGFEVCRRIRTLPDFARYAALPVLVLSARIEESSRKRAMEVGANAYLTKPVKFADLLNELGRLITKGQIQALQAPATHPVEPVATMPSAPSPPPQVMATKPETPATHPAEPMAGTPPQVTTSKPETPASHPAEPMPGTPPQVTASKPNVPADHPVEPVAGPPPVPPVSEHKNEEPPRGENAAPTPGTPPRKSD